MIRIILAGILISISFLNSCSGFKESIIRYRIDKELNRIFSPDMPGAAIIAVYKGKIVYKNAFGLANVELKVELKPEMCFKIGSVTKQFTGTAILILEERGLISLEDEMIKYLPGYSSVYHGVKIIHLLSHTSGIKNYTGYNNGIKIIHERYNLKELADIMLNEQPEFYPGEKWEYSNSNYTLLAFIIEKVTGNNYRNFIIENIIKPCKMYSTCFADDESVINGLVNGYMVDGDKLKPAEFMSMTHTIGAGDIISCVGDMAKWNSALLAGELISNDNVTRCFTPTVLNDRILTNNGIGWFMDNYRNMTTYYHDGGVYGFQSLCTYIPEKDLYIAVLRNRSDVNIKYPSYVISNMIADYILGYKSETSEHIPIPLSEEQLKKYTGTYQFVESPGKRKISLTEGRLYYERPPRKGNVWSRNEIKPESIYSFYAEGKKSTISFEFNNNEVIGMNINQAFGRVVKLKKIE